MFHFILFYHAFAVTLHTFYNTHIFIDDTNREVVQLRAFARQDGALMALVWIASFLFTVYVPQNGIGSLLAITIPFVLGWRLCAFRNYARDGIISFRRAYLYCVYTFFYASLIFAVAQFVFFKFFDHGTFA